MASILVVEDSLDTIELIEVALGGHHLRIEKSLQGARERIAEGTEIDLILLDLNLPDGDGFTLGTQLSAAGQTTIPIIVLSSRCDVRDKVTAFSFGAEDYVEKPFDVLELQARVAAKLRKIQQRDRREFLFERGGLRVDLENMRAFILAEEGSEGTWEEIDLSVTEHRIFKALLEKPNGVRTRDQLMSQIWGDRIVGPRTIDSHVSNLRAKISKSSVQIESVRGLGYRLSLHD